MNVVSIMAHQDDEMRCLGTMLKCRERGDKLFFITLTDGCKGIFRQPPLTREEAAKTRQREMNALAKAVEAEYIHLDEHDEFLYDTPDVRIKLIEAIRKTGAHLIFTHYERDYNLDHTTTYQLVLHCAMQSCLPGISTHTNPLKEHPAIFTVEPHGPFSFPALHYVDITRHHKRKIELLMNHVSQEETMQKAFGMGFEKMNAELALYRGSLVGCEYAECFIPMQARGAIKPYPVLP